MDKLTHFKWKYLGLLLTAGVMAGTLPGCGSGSGISSNETGPDDTAPTVTVTPADGATDVERNAVISATFDEDMFAITVDESGFSLSDGSNVNGTLSFDAMANVATFTPSDKLAVLTRYNAVLAGSITDLSGNPLAPVNLSFTTADGTWGSEGLVESQSNDAGNPGIALAANGDAIAVWEQQDGVLVNIWANTYSADSSSWGTEVLIDSEDLGDAHDPKVVVDDNGNATVVWQQHDGTRENIWASHYSASSASWGSAALIENQDSGSAERPEIAMDVNGNAMVILAIGSDLWANYYNANGSWSGEINIDNDNQYINSPSVAFDSDGNVVAVWQQYHNPAPYLNNIWANHYTAGSGWGAAQLIENDDIYNGSNPQVAVEPSGNAIAIWIQYDATHINLHASRYDSTTERWEASEVISSIAQGTYATISGHKIAFAADGSAIAVWQQSIGDSPSVSDIIASHYSAATGWGSASVIDSIADYDVYEPKIAMDRNGNTLALWGQENSAFSNDIWVNRYIAGSGWSGAQIIEGNTDPVLDADAYQIAMNSNGEAMGIWQLENDDTETDAHIWANRFE
ncbi:MAG: Ig-like domain-containing protein [Halopseudomonas sp.]